MKTLRKKMKKRSNGGSTKSLSKSLFNSIVFGKEIIMKKIEQKMKKMDVGWCVGGDCSGDGLGGFCPGNGT